LAIAGHARPQVALDKALRSRAHNAVLVLGGSEQMLPRLR
jgi:hypothetical protein